MPTLEQTDAVPCERIELGGVRYVILTEAHYERLCAAYVPGGKPARGSGGLSPLQLDRATLAQRLLSRRRGAGLSQAELARRAGIRVETLNRIERGHTTPDYATIRKLMVALKETAGGG